MLFERLERPASAAECVSLLAAYGDGAKLLAGGTDVIPKLRLSGVKLKALIDLGGVPGLDGFTECAEGLRIGVMARLRDIQDRRRLMGPYEVVSECASHVSSIQVRNVATIGGNSCNASPSADTVPGLIALGAVVEIEGGGGRRRVPLECFEAGPGKTVLGADEMALSFWIPAPPPRTAAAYSKYAIRGDSDIAIIGVAARLTLDARGRISEAALVLAAVAPKHVRTPRAEALLIGEEPGEELFLEAARVCMEDCAPITDQRATAAYRKKMIRVFAAETLRTAWARLENGR